MIKTYRNAHNKLVLLLGLLTSSILLSGCQGNYSFHSNLDIDNIEHYFQVRDISIYDNNQFPSKTFEVLALVTEDDCQIDPNAQPASLSIVHNKLREAALAVKANAVIIAGCSNQPIDDNICLSQITCTGQAVAMAQ